MKLPNYAGVAALLLLTVCHAAPGRVSAQAAFTFCAGNNGPDDDADGLTNVCEIDLARRFAPVFTVRSDGCNWDAANSRLGGGYFFAVQTVDSVLRIAYLPAYFRDCGWSGPKCWVPVIDCSPHHGDSEFVVIELSSGGDDDMRITAVFLSAHCFGRSGSDCRWYRGEDLERFEWRGAAPVIWVAEGRNANYPSRRACDRGHHSIDTCDRNNLELAFPIIDGRNIGGMTKPLLRDGCVGGKELGSTMIDPDAVECFWQDKARFRGWSPTAKGVTGYFRYLVEIARF